MTLIRSIGPELVVMTVVLVGVAAAASAQMPAPDDVAAAPADAETMASGLAHKMLQAGTGEQHPGPRSNVTVHYTGWLTDGTMFDSSVARGAPASFPLNGVIAGWTEGVQLMVVGEKRRFWIPASIGYGDRGGGGGLIPGGATLVFDIELLSIQ
ncbi:MAG: FKBP-type peptidyl-prolyl cis-trans isomerase [Acidobacteria bacterium]|nr:MAG: FKBP-type peptidyl-prolyl cis-trans isomerase [Acidobacteriota bacterium]